MISRELVCHFLIVRLVAAAASCSECITWDIPIWLQYAFCHAISDRWQQGEEKMV